MNNSLSDRARSILNENDLGDYTVPTKGLYPYQWNWDSAFSAIGLASFNSERGWTEIETLLDAQWECGFVPHIIFRVDDPSYFPGPQVWQGRAHIPSSGISNPPVVASIVRTMIGNEFECADDRLQAIFHSLLRWHRWFKQCRDFEGNGVVVSVHPWEGGRDNSPEWDIPASSVDTSNVGDYQRRDTSHVDAAMRPKQQDYDRYIALLQYGRSTGWDHNLIGEAGPFRVVDVGMTMILIKANRDLLWLAKRLKKTVAIQEISSWIDTSEQGIDYLWDEKVNAFCSRDTMTGESSGIITNASFLSFYAEVGSSVQKQSMLSHLERISKQCSFLVPSLDPEHPEFDAMRYWRGPVWLVLNYMISQGLFNCGYRDWAEKVRQDSGDLVQQSGFYESFSPTTGDGTGGELFSWTAAMWLAWCGHDRETMS